MSKPVYITGGMNAGMPRTIRPKSTDDIAKISEAMQLHGGGFERAFGVLLSRADIQNIRTLVMAFPDLIDTWAAYVESKNAS